MSQIALHLLKINFLHIINIKSQLGGAKMSILIQFSSYFFGSLEKPSVFYFLLGKDKAYINKTWWYFLEISNHFDLSCQGNAYYDSNNTDWLLVSFNNTPKFD